MSSAKLTRRRTLYVAIICIWILAAILAAILQKYYGKTVWVASAAAALGTVGSVIGIVLDKILPDFSERGTASAHLNGRSTLHNTPPYGSCHQ